MGDEKDSIRMGFKRNQERKTAPNMRILYFPADRSESLMEDDWGV